MAIRRPRAWFASKRYGYGSSLPIVWQGWVALVTLLLAILASRLVLHGPVRFAGMGFAIIAFAILCATKTEGGWRWRWRWDEDD